MSRNAGSRRRINARRRAFTLLELLVVIAVITLLMALVMPSLKRARYEAKLLTCRSNLRQIGVAVISHALSADGHYPRREVNHIATHAGACDLYGDGVDDRPMLNKIFPVDSLLICALSPQPKKKNFLTSNPPRRWVVCSYELWFGSEIQRGNTATRQLRMGDRPVWGGRSFNVLVSDWGRISWGSLNSAHPDPQSVLSPSISDNPSDTRFTSWGASLAVAQTRKIDRNFLLDDGSVSLVRGLNPVNDPRTISVPYYARDFGQGLNTTPTRLLPEK